MTWMIEELQKKQLVLGVSALGRRWRYPPETEQKDNSHRHTRKLVGIMEAKEWRKQFSLEMVTILGWMVSLSCANI